MRKNPSDMNHRDRQILCGLFLSKFDQEGLAYLGFTGFVEAFNALGYSLQAKPASIKNYRDELDPYFQNARKGWHKRPLREHCQRIMDSFKDASMEQLGELIRDSLMPREKLATIPEINRVLNNQFSEDAPSSFAKRLITGKAAEHYFATNYSAILDFTGMALTDTTGWGCGFDFKLTRPASGEYYAVEVKGLRARCGNIQLTELEYDMADALRDKYYLVLVRNFVEAPFHTVLKNPTTCSIKFTKIERKEIRRSWTANIVE